MVLPTPELVNCPHCQAKNPVVEDLCQHCRRPLAVYIGPPARVPRRIGLGALMLLIALIAVCLGVMREVPPLGAALLLFLVPGLLRTTRWAAQRAADGRPMAAVEKVGAFAGSVAVVWLLVVLAGVAFGLTFLAGYLLAQGLAALASLFVGDPVSTGWCFSAGLAWGLAGALAALYSLGRLLWPIED